MPSTIVERLRTDIDTNARIVAADYIEELEAKLAALAPAPTAESSVPASRSVDPAPSEAAEPTIEAAQPEAPPE